MSREGGKKGGMEGGRKGGMGTTTVTSDGGT